MRRIFLFLSVVLLLCSPAKANITNDVSNIRTNLSNLLYFIVDEYSVAVWDYLSAIYDDLSALHADLWDPDSDPISVHDSQLQDVLDALGSSGVIVSEILNLNALLQGISADSSLIWSILDTAEDGGLIRTDPDYSGLMNILENLGVSVNNFSDLLEELEDWHPDITGEVTATLDGPVVIGEMPPVEVDLSDVDFSYFDDWQADNHSLFENWSSYDLTGFKWSSNVDLGKGSVNDVTEDSDSGSGNWFEQVLDMLQFGVNQEGQINRSIIELMAKIAPTNASEVTSQIDTLMSGLDSQIAQLSQMDIENDSSLAKLTQGNTVVKDYAKFGSLSPMFSGAGTLGSYIHIHFGDTVGENGNTLELSGDIPVDEFSGFFDKCRQGASIMWWLLTFLFSVLVTFRVFALFRKVNDTFFRMPIGFGA